LTPGTELSASCQNVGTQAAERTGKARPRRAAVQTRLRGPGKGEPTALNAKDTGGDERHNDAIYARACLACAERPDGHGLERNTAIFLDYVRKNPRTPWKLTPILPESGKQRRFFEGAVVPLVTYYQEGLDHRNSEDCARVREWLKSEFNGEYVLVAGKSHPVPKSTKGRDALQLFLERVITWLVENYSPPLEALDLASFKVWQDTVFPSGGPDNYVDYLSECGILR
jgi:hypothetical protein